MKLVKYVKSHWVSLALIVILCGCSGMVKVPFEESSLDFNNGQPYKNTLDSISLDESISKVISLFKERGFYLVQKNCDANLCQVEFKSEATNKSLTMGSVYGSGSHGTSSTYGSVNTVNLERGSRIFVKMEKIENNVYLSMIGVPILNQEMSCPTYLSENFRKCDVPRLNSYKNKDLATSVKQQWGYDISGKTEAEVIQGVMAEME